MQTESILMAFGLTLFAGLSTGVGSALAFFAKRTHTMVLSVALGFSAGVMIYVSFVEIFDQANQALSQELGAGPGGWATAGAFLGGMVLIAAIDRLVPNLENPHEVRKVEDLEKPEVARSYSKLYKTGMFTALAIGIHNFPEGLAVFAATLQDPSLGLPVAVAIAIHNIPEGIAVAFPIFYATGNRSRAFFYSVLSGLAEPAGAALGFLFLLPWFTPTVFGVLFASVGGIMVFISLDELLPAAREYGQPHLAIYGLIAGMAVMAASLLMLN
jgi:ZIP family zinc transporter